MGGDFEFLTNAELARVGQAICLHQVVVRNLKAAGDHVEVITGGQGVFARSRGRGDLLFSLNWRRCDCSFLLFDWGIARGRLSSCSLDFEFGIRGDDWLSLSSSGGGLLGFTNRLRIRTRGKEGLPRGGIINLGGGWR